MADSEVSFLIYESETDPKAKLYLDLRNKVGWDGTGIPPDMHADESAWWRKHKPSTYGQRVTANSYTMALCGDCSDDAGLVDRVWVGGRWVWIFTCTPEVPWR